MTIAPKGKRLTVKTSPTEETSSNVRCGARILVRNHRLKRVCWALWITCVALCRLLAFDEEIRRRQFKLNIGDGRVVGTFWFLSRPYAVRTRPLAGAAAFHIRIAIVRPLTESNARYLGSFRWHGHTGPGGKRCRLLFQSGTEAMTQTRRSSQSRRERQKSKKSSCPDAPPKLSRRGAAGRTANAGRERQPVAQHRQIRWT